MKYTNKYNLPQAIVNAITNDDYPRIDEKAFTKISATQLIDCPQVVQLRRRHYHELTEDVSSMIWIMWGKAIHNMLERTNKEDLSHERLDAEVDDITLTGEFDLLTETHKHFAKDSDKIKKLVDYKVTSVYTMKNPERWQHWRNQLRVYRYLAARHDIQVDAAAIIALLRDWSMRHLYDDDLPNVAMAEIEIELDDLSSIENYIRGRIAVHKLAALLPDKDLPVCTAEDQWRHDAAYKIMKKGRKSSVRNLPTEEQAIQFGIKKGFFEDGKWKTGYSLLYVPGEATRCEHYCDVKQFCHQYKQEHAEQDANQGE